MTLVLQRNCIGRPVAEPVTLPPRRRRLLDVIDGHADHSRPFIVSRHRRGETLAPQDRNVLLRDRWRRIRLRKNDIVVITYLPLGGGGEGGGGGKQIGAAIAMLALAIAVPYALPMLIPGLAAAGGGLTLLGQFVAAGIVMGGAYIVGMATRAKAEQDSSDTRPVYGVAGGGNLPRPGDRIPAPYGRFWHKPDLSQPQYSVYDGEDQILYQRMTLGLGKYQVHRIMVGPATLWNEDDGVVSPFDVRQSGSGGGSQVGAGGGGGGVGGGEGSEVEVIAPGELSTLVPGSVYSSPSVGGTEMPRPEDIPNRAGPFPVCPVGQTTKLIQIDQSLPGGLYALNSKGAVPFGCRYEYAPIDEDDQPTGPFVELLSDSGTFRSTRAVRKTHLIAVPEGRYAVQAFNTQPLNENVINAVYWDGLRAHFEDTTARPHVTEIAVRIVSGKHTSAAAFNEIWVEATRILPVYDLVEEEWVEQPTRKAIWAFADILRAAYGGNIVDADLDLSRLAYYDEALADNDTFDGVIRGPVSVFEAAATALGVIRGEPTRVGRTWSVSRDEQRTVRKHVFSRRQIVRQSSMAEFQVARDDGAADVIAEYYVGGDPRQRREVRVTFGAESLTPRRQLLFGVSDFDHAHSLATWMAASAFYRRETRSFVVDRQGRLITRGDPVRADVWFMSDAKAAGVVESDGLELRLDTVLPIDPTSYALLRDRRGREFGPLAVAATDDPNVVELNADDVAAYESFHGITLVSALAPEDGSEEQTAILIGPLAELQQPYTIRSAMPQGRNRVEIEAVHDHPGVWTALAEAPPAEPSIPSFEALNDPTFPSVPWVRAQAVQKTTGLSMEWAVGAARGAVTYIVELSQNDGESWEAVSEGIQVSGSHPIDHFPAGATADVRAYALNALGIPGPAVETQFATFAPVIRLTDFEESLRDYVTSYVGEARQQIKASVDRIALLVARQDAANYSDRRELTRQIASEHESVKAKFKEVITVMTSADAALAQQITSVSAELSEAIGSEVERIEQAYADADLVLAESILSLQSSLNNVDASILARFVAGVTPAGAVAAYELELRAELARVGMRLVALGGGIGIVQFDGDKFLIGKTGQGGYNPAFIFDVTEGKFVLDVDEMVVSGGIKAAHIATAAITAEKIAANAITTAKLAAGAITAEKITANTITVDRLVDKSITEPVAKRNVSGGSQAVPNSSLATYTKLDEIGNFVKDSNTKTVIFQCNGLITCTVVDSATVQVIVELRIAGAVVGEWRSIGTTSTITVPAIISSFWPASSFSNGTKTIELWAGAKLLAGSSSNCEISWSAAAFGFGANGFRA